jgi:uncharacterized SAM-binding protein YcdF (DUF218 family)
VAQTYLIFFMKKYWQNKWIRRLIYCATILLLFVIFLKPILRGMGHYLVDTDPLEYSELVVVLGGNSFERGMEAMKVHHIHPAKRYVTTGGNIPSALLALDTSLFEAQLTAHLMIKKGMPDSLITPLTAATSTQEEAIEVRAFAEKENFKTITVISNDYHIRRVRRTFDKAFEGSNIVLRYHGAKSDDFDPDAWWKKESGLVLTNNEYIKLMYYFIKH